MKANLLLKYQVEQKLQNIFDSYSMDFELGDSYMDYINKEYNDLKESLSNLGSIPELEVNNILEYLDNHLYDGPYHCGYGIPKCSLKVNKYIFNKDKLIHKINESDVLIVYHDWDEAYSEPRLLSEYETNKKFSEVLNMSHIEQILRKTGTNIDPSTFYLDHQDIATTGSSYELMRLKIEFERDDEKYNLEIVLE